MTSDQQFANPNARYPTAEAAPSELLQPANGTVNSNPTSHFIAIHSTCEEIPCRSASGLAEIRDDDGAADRLGLSQD